MARVMSMSVSLRIANVHSKTLVRGKSSKGGTQFGKRREKYGFGEIMESIKVRLEAALDRLARCRGYACRCTRPRRVGCACLRGRAQVRGGFRKKRRRG